MHVGRCLYIIVIPQDVYCSQVEGVAYRGRLLVEVSSTLDVTLPKMIKQSMDPRDFAREKLNTNFAGSSVKYKLFALMLCGNMVHPHNDLVEFEVSIG